MIFDNRENLEAKSIPFNWGVDYLDGTFLKEYKDDEEGRNDYYSIRVYMIDRFGIFGSGHKYFYTRDGAFYFDGKRLDIEYHTDGKILGMTSRYENKDCITYKDAHVKRNPSKEVQDTIVDAINFGYKTLYDFDGLQVYFQAIVKVAIDGSMEMQIKSTANMNKEGILVFKDKDEILGSFNFPLMMNHSSNINWTMK